MKFLFIGMLIGFCISLLSVFLTLMFSPSQKIDGLYDVEISNNNRCNDQPDEVDVHKYGQKSTKMWPHRPDHDVPVEDHELHKLQSNGKFCHNPGDSTIPAFVKP